MPTPTPGPTPLAIGAAMGRCMPPRTIARRPSARTSTACARRASTSAAWRGSAGATSARPSTTATTATPTITPGTTAPGPIARGPIAPGPITAGTTADAARGAAQQSLEGGIANLYSALPALRALSAAEGPVIARSLAGTLTTYGGNHAPLVSWRRV